MTSSLSQTSLGSVLKKRVVSEEILGAQIVRRAMMIVMVPRSIYAQRSGTQKDRIDRGSDAFPVCHF